MSLWSKIRSFFARKASGVLSPPSSTETEFSAEVVRIIALEPHGNADKLEIARIEFAGSGPSGYQIVVRKGEYRVGDLAGYFSVDCVVPTTGPFAFLAERPDGKGKTHFKLRAARLRGVFSQGLLITSHNVPPIFGIPLAKTFGVTYHVDETPEARGSTPPSARPKPQPAPKYAVDSMRKLPNLFDPQETVFITEKIHGTNFRFGWVPRKFLGLTIGHRFFVGSHNVEKGRGGGSYYGTDIYAEAAQKMGLKELTRGHKGLVFYGELFGRTFSGGAIQKGFEYGGSILSIPSLAVFDIWCTRGKFYYTVYEREDVLSDLKFASPPLMPGSGSTYEEAIETIKEYDGRNSNLCPVTLMEGVVIESVDRKKKAKLVFQAYLEQK